MSIHIYKSCIKQRTALQEFPTARLKYAVCGLAILALFTRTTQADAIDGDGALSATFGITSDYVFRGVSQTMGQVALQGSIDAEFESGFYASAWGSTVDFVADGEPDDGADLELDIAIGFETAIDDRWTVDLMYVQYLFPGANTELDYDYGEMLGTVTWQEFLCATIGYSNDVFGSGADGWVYQLGTEVDIFANLKVSTFYGYYDLHTAYDASYSYLEVGVSRELGFLSVGLSYHNTWGAVDELFYEETTGSRIALSLEIKH
ncbi:MAG: TorF family putative porin [Pseudomonadales bacterium]